MSLEAALNILNRHAGEALSALERTGTLVGHAKGLEKAVSRGTIRPVHVGENLLDAVRTELLNSTAIKPEHFERVIMPKLLPHIEGHANAFVRALPKTPLEIEQVAGRGFWGNANEIRYFLGDALSGKFFTEAGRFERKMGQMERAAERHFNRAGAHHANDYAERINDVIADGHERIFQAKMDKRVDEIVNGPAREAEEAAAKKAAELAESKKWSTPTKILVGGGAATGGVLAYNALSGAGNNNAGVMAQAEEAGAQAAMRDAMMSGYDVGVRGGYGQPTPKISAANANYEGRLLDSQHLALA